MIYPDVNINLFLKRYISKRSLSVYLTLSVGRISQKVHEKFRGKVTTSQQHFCFPFNVRPKTVVLDTRELLCSRTRIFSWSWYFTITFRWWELYKFVTTYLSWTIANLQERLVALAVE